MSGARFKLKSVVAVICFLAIACQAPEDPLATSNEENITDGVSEIEPVKSILSDIRYEWKNCTDSEEKCAARVANDQLSLQQHDLCLESIKGEPAAMLCTQK